MGALGFDVLGLKCGRVRGHFADWASYFNGKIWKPDPGYGCHCQWRAPCNAGRIEPQTLLHEISPNRAIARTENALFIFEMIGCNVFFLKMHFLFLLHYFHTQTL